MKTIGGAYQNAIKIEELESIRGLAALLIVFHHIPKWNPILDTKIINNGYLMVELFFVLSGFVIFSAYANKIGDKRDLLRFQFLRFGRLYPVHLLFLFIFIFIELAKYFSQLKLGFISNTPAFRENNLTAIVEQIFLIQSIGPTGNDVTFNGPAWSISVEFYTYFIFGLIVLLLGRAKNILFTLLATTSLLMLMTHLTFGFDDFLRCIAGFFVGCLTANVTKHIKKTLSNCIPLAALSAIICFLQFKTSKDFDLLIYFLTAALIASLVLSQQSLLKKILLLKPLTWLGAISYSVYMSHSAILVALHQVMRFILKRPLIMGADGKSIPQLSQSETIIVWTLITMIILIVSALVYNFIELPMRKKSRSFAFSRLS